MNPNHPTWCPQEQNLLYILKDQKAGSSWNQISQILSQQHGFTPKTPKECQQRYSQQIMPVNSKIQWTEDQQRLFLVLHNQIGNKWASIAQKLNGKTDNCVKNHFYSKLRKLLRKLNRIIQFYLKRIFRPIDISIMYKIVEAAEQRFKDKPNCQENVSLQCLNVQNKMLQYAMFKQDQNQNDQQLNYNPSKINEYKELIENIYRVSKLYKRKSKKVRNSMIQAPVNHSRKKIKNCPRKQNQSKEQFQPSQNQHNNKVQTTILINNPNQITTDYKSQKQINEQEAQLNARHDKNKIQVEEGEGIHNLLRTAGILHDQLPYRRVETKRKRKNSESQNSPAHSTAQNVINPIVNNSSYSNLQNSSLNDFSSNQTESYLGFPMVNTGQNNNGYASFTLSEKSSFKSYSEADPSEIQNPFFDYDSSNNRCMFPMNFAFPPQAYINPYYNNFNYQNFYPKSQEGEGNEPEKKEKTEK